MSRLKDYVKKNYAKLTVPILLGIVAIIFSCISSNFYQISNITTLFRQISILCIICCGVTLVLISGGIDLSTGSVAVMSGVFWSMMEYAGYGGVLSFLVAVICGFFLGLINGLLITRTKINPMIATIGTSTIIQNLVWIIRDGGNPVMGMPDSAKFLGQGVILGFLPVPVLIMIICLLINRFVLNKTYFGRGLYATGSNEEASRLSGLDTKKLRTMAYVVSGVFAAIAGVVMMSRINMGQPAAGQEYQMDSITACVIGGVSFAGGEGSAICAFLGALLIGMINNGLTVIHVNEYAKLIIRGSILVFAVSIDALQRSKVEKEKKAIKHSA